MSGRSKYRQVVLRYQPDVIGVQFQQTMKGAGITLRKEYRHQQGRVVLMMEAARISNTCSAFHKVVHIMAMVLIARPQIAQSQQEHVV
jgi:hypothetical protein